MNQTSQKRTLACAKRNHGTAKSHLITSVFVRYRESPSPFSVSTTAPDNSEQTNSSAYKFNSKKSNIGFMDQAKHHAMDPLGSACLTFVDLAGSDVDSAVESNINGTNNAINNQNTNSTTATTINNSPTSNVNIQKIMESTSIDQSLASLHGLMKGYSVGLDPTTLGNSQAFSPTVVPASTLSRVLTSPLYGGITANGIEGGGLSVGDGSGGRYSRPDFQTMIKKRPNAADINNIKNNGRIMGGSIGKTILIVCASPLVDCGKETERSLLYGSSIKELNIEQLDGYI